MGEDIRGWLARLEACAEADAGARRRVSLGLPTAPSASSCCCWGVCGREMHSVCVVTAGSMAAPPHAAWVSDASVPMEGCRWLFAADRAAALLPVLPWPRGCLALGSGRGNTQPDGTCLQTRTHADMCN